MSKKILMSICGVIFIAYIGLVGMGYANDAFKIDNQIVFDVAAQAVFPIIGVVFGAYITATQNGGGQRINPPPFLLTTLSFLVTFSYISVLILSLFLYALDGEVASRHLAFAKILISGAQGAVAVIIIPYFLSLNGYLVY